jgi:hypothetical protein
VEEVEEVELVEEATEATEAVERGEVVERRRSSRVWLERSRVSRALAGRGGRRREEAWCAVVGRRRAIPPERVRDSRSAEGGVGGR